MICVLSAHVGACVPDARYTRDMRRHLPEQVDRAVRRYRRGLDAAFPGRVVRLTVFGSQTRGEADEDSDVDVLLVLSGLTNDERAQATNLGAEAGLSEDLVFTPLVLGALEWADMVRRELLLIEEI